MINLVKELAPLNDPSYHEQPRPAAVDWTAPGLQITRLRLLSDPGYPAYDVSYCHGVLNGTQVQVLLPFNQLPKHGMRSALYAHARRTGCYIDGLFSSISTLQ